LTSGIGVTGLGIRRHMPDWEIETVDQIGAILDTLPDSKNGIVSFWPGYFINSTYRPLHGLENQFGILTAKKLKDRSLAERFHLLSEDAAWEVLGSRASLMILNTHNLSRQKLRAIRQHSLSPVANIEKITIYRVKK
jgi:hypothetical protein